MFYDRKKMFDGIREAFGSLNQKQVDGIEILVAEGERRNFNTEWISYILATAWHETSKTMQPVRETLAKSDAVAIARLDKAYAKGQLKGVTKNYWSDGFFGRGYVQLTHEYNYKKMGDWLGIDLVNDPSKALDPKVAAKIIYEGMLRGMFTAKKLSDYLDGVDEADAEDEREFANARRIVNGTDRAKTIAGYSLKFEKALRGSEVVLPNSKPKAGQDVVAEVMPTPPTKEGKAAMKSTTIWATLGTVTTAAAGMLMNLHPVVQGMLILIVAGFAFWIIKERLSGNKEIERIL